MFRKLMALLLPIVLFASACNGHEASSKDQVIELGQIDTAWDAADELEHNHGIAQHNGADRAVAWVTWDDVSDDANTVGIVEVCLIWVVTDSNDDVTASGENCSPQTVISNGSGPFTVKAVGPRVSDYPGETLNAYESTVDIWDNNTFLATCEYHDPDDSNPTACPGRDADGN